MSPLRQEKIFTLVDVGARGGLHPRWYRFAREIQSVLFEPDENEARVLSQNPENNIVIPTAIGDRVRTAPFYICRDTSCSSCLKPNLEFLRRFPEVERFTVDKETEVSLSTLDIELEKNRILEPSFLKIDVQGFELSILTGGNESLKSCVGLELEVNFASLYENGCSFAEIDLHLTRLGFELFDLRRYYWKRTETSAVSQAKGQLIFGDALYLRPPESLRSQFRSEMKLIEALVAYSAYGYGDACQTISSSIDSKSELAKTAAKIISTLPKATLLNNFPYFRGRSRLHDSVLKLSDLLSPGLWRAGYDKRLGNLFVD